MERPLYLALLLCGVLAVGTSVGGSRPAKVTPATIRRLTEQLYQADAASVGDRITLRLQGTTTSTSEQDKAPERLFQPIPATALRGPTVAALAALLDNYERDAARREVTSAQETREEDAFLNALMATAVMKKTQKFLKDNGYITGSLKPILRGLWLTTYRRGRALSSSGLEHVLVGEVKGMKVSGFHGWLSFYMQEQKGNLNYYGYMKVKDIAPKIKLLLAKFKWFRKDKSLGSMFIGISPELELSLYTVCFFTRPGSNCPVSLNGNRFNVKTYVQNHNGKQTVGSAFPNM